MKSVAPNTRWKYVGDYCFKNTVHTVIYCDPDIDEIITVSDNAGWLGDIAKFSEEFVPA